MFRNVGMAKYHIDRNGNPQLCRAEVRTCPRGATESEHYPTKKAASEAYQAGQQANLLPTLRKPAASKESFPDSKVRNKDGTLRTVYHGTDAAFDKFDNAFTGKGVDAYGSGFYFSSDESGSRGYGKNLMKVRINLKNPIVVDGKSGSLNEFEISQQEVVGILQKHPDIYLDPATAEKEERDNPLGDYLPEYWDKQNLTKSEIDGMIRKVAREFFDSPGNFTYLENTFGDDNASIFRKAVTENCGWDGVQINFPDGLNHYVAWDSEQIEIIP